MRWWQIARSQAGVASHSQLIAAGRSGRYIQSARERGELTRICRGVYLVGGAPWSRHARLWAAVLSTGGTLCRETSGALWGMCADDRDSVHVQVTHSRRVAIPAGVRVHRCRPAGPVQHQSDLPVFSRSATVVELLGCLRPTDASKLADRALQRGWMEASDVQRRLRTQPRRPGNAQLRRILAQLGDGAAAESERVLHRLLHAAGITVWRANHPVWADGELVAVVDIAMIDRKVAIEVDGMAFHTDVEAFRRDRTRQNMLVRLGWTVLRFTWADLTQRPWYVVATIQHVAA